MSKVFLAGGDAYAAAKKVLEISNFKELIRGKNKIVIKPNLVSGLSAKHGVTTDVEIVRAILDFCPTGSDITIVEGTAGAVESFEKNGYMGLKKEYDVNIIDCNKFGYKKVKVDGLIFNEITVCKKVLDCDFLISAAKLKIHSVMKVTATLKNMMGVCPKSQRLLIHSNFPEALVDLISVRRPDFGIVDGVIANELDEIHSHPVKMGVVLGGTDGVAVDSVAALIIGVDPNMVSYINLAARQGLGSADNVQIVGESVEKFSKKLRTVCFNPRSMGQIFVIKALTKLGLFIWYNNNIIPYVKNAKRHLNNGK